MAPLRLFFIIGITLFLVPSAFALSIFNMYIDETGDVLFLGETDLVEGLPDGTRISALGEVTGSTAALTTKTGETWTFSYAQDETDMSVYLPEGATITSISGGEIALSRNRIVIYEVDALEVTYVLGDVAPPSSGSSLKTLGWILLGVLGLIIIVFIANIFNREKKEEHKHEHTPQPAPDRYHALRGVLNKREQAIIDALRKLGSVKSSYLRKHVGLPKASFSRHIQELEKKGLITRTGEGRNKIISLAE